MIWVASGVRDNSIHFSVKDFLLNMDGIHIDFQAKFPSLSYLFRCRGIQLRNAGSQLFHHSSYSAVPSK